MEAHKEETIIYEIKLEPIELNDMLYILQRGINSLKEGINNSEIFNRIGVKSVVSTWENNIKCLATLIERGCWIE